MAYQKYLEIMRHLKKWKIEKLNTKMGGCEATLVKLCRWRCQNKGEDNESNHEEESCPTREEMLRNRK